MGELKENNNKMNLKNKNKKSQLVWFLFLLGLLLAGCTGNNFW
jgi:hypothetical protein